MACALGPSRIWVTIGRGIINEVYYPRIDIPQIRDLGFIVADDRGFWSEVKRLNHYELRNTPGFPELHCTHHHQRYTLTLRIVPDDRCDALRIKLDLDGDEALRPYALLAPHLGGTGHNNYAAVGEHFGRRVLWAEQGPFGLALAAVDHRQWDAFGRASAGYVGVSDGWQDFTKNGAMRWNYASAGPGNVALMGELPRSAELVLAFGSSKQAAATRAVSTLLMPYAEVARRQHTNWQAWHKLRERRRPAPTDLPENLRKQWLLSIQVLRTHQDKIYPGAMVASLSVPWGASHDERGGYHLVWPRDLVETAGALLAVGAEEDARDILRYLIATQNTDGHWFQNQWLEGTPYWNGIQLDECAFPVLLAAALAQRKALDGIEVSDMVYRALAFIARNGPASAQDRWEEDAGVNTFTLAVCIAALVAGAPFLDAEARDFALVLADFWNAHIEDWTTVSGTDLAKRLGIEDYYVREAPVQMITDSRALRQVLPIKNHSDNPHIPADEQIGVDFLQLVRFGLRRADDAVIVNTVKLADSLLKVDTPSGPAWHRYNGDGYGEHRDGTPFNGSGIGRAWPLLSGERGHYELAAGRDILPFLQAMVNMSGRGGLIPEQVWDAAPIPKYRLESGRPSGSAMPLVWAHAEFIKLVASRSLGHPFDRSDAVWIRYQGVRPTTLQALWCQQAPISRVKAGTRVSVCTHRSTLIHVSYDGWKTTHDVTTVDTGLGLHAAALETANLVAGQRIDFAVCERDTNSWWGRNYSIDIVTDEQECGSR